MKRLLVATLSLLLLCGCSKRLEESIAQRIDETCKSSEPCVLRIKDLTHFEWDKMYVFEYSAELYDIETALGTSFPDFVQFRRRMVFLKGGRIVYREDEPTDIERILDGQVVFDIPDAEVYRVYGPDAEFLATKRKVDERTYYALEQIRWRARRSRTPRLTTACTRPATRRLSSSAEAWAGG